MQETECALFLQPQHTPHGAFYVAIFGVYRSYSEYMRHREDDHVSVWYVFLTAESITQLSGGECLPPYGRTASHVTSMTYTDSAYKDIARYYYYYPQCSPDVISAHGLHQHQHHQHPPQHQQQSVMAIHPHDGLVYHAHSTENGREAGPETTARAGDGYGEAAVGAAAGLRYYAKSPSGPGLVVDGCRPMTAPVASWTCADHGQFHARWKLFFCHRH